MATVGVSLAALMVILILSESVSVPPVPVFPKSLVVMVSTAVPLKFAVGLNVSVANAALISVCVPRNTKLPSAVPSPVINAKPATPASVNVPLVTESVTSKSLLPASRSST